MRIRTRLHVLSLVFSAIAAGCGGGSDDKLPRQAIAGKITLDGQPLARGSISLDPSTPGQKDAVSVGATVVNGSYSIAKGEGPTPGTYRVSILDAADSDAVSLTEAPGAPKKKTAKPTIPAKYNLESKLTAEVKEGGNSSLNFELSSK